MDEHGPERGEQPVSRRMDLGAWTLNKIDIRTSIGGRQWPVARVELQHPERGRVTDIATAPGAFEAVFKAAGLIVGIDPKLLSYNVRSSSYGDDRSLTIKVEIGLEIDGRAHLGNSSGSDLVRCSLLAWLEAARNIGAGDAGSALPSGGDFK